VKYAKEAKWKFAKRPMKTKKLNLLIYDMRLTISKRTERAMVTAGSKDPVRAAWLRVAAFAKGPCGRPPGAPGGDEICEKAIRLR